MKERISGLLDWIALGALASAASLLGCGLWFSESFLMPLFLQGFGTGLSICAASFLLARLLELTPFLRHAWHNSYPRAQAAGAQQPQRILALVAARDRRTGSEVGEVSQGLDDAA